MFSTFVGLGRLISCQRPDYKIDPRKWQTFFENMFVFRVDRRMCVRYNCKHKERTNVP